MLCFNLVTHSLMNCILFFKKFSKLHIFHNFINLSQKIFFFFRDFSSIFKKTIKLPLTQKVGHSLTFLNVKNSTKIKGLQRTTDAFLLSSVDFFFHCKKT